MKAGHRNGRGHDRLLALSLLLLVVVIVAVIAAYRN